MKTHPVIVNIEGVDGNLHTLGKDISSAFNKYFSSVVTQEDPNTVPTFHVDKCDHISLSTITIDPSLVFEKLVSLKTGKSPDGQLRFLNNVQISYVSLYLFCLLNP